MSVFRFSPPNISKFAFPAAATVACIGALAYIAYRKLKSVYQSTTPEMLAQQVIDFEVSDAGDEILHVSDSSNPPPGGKGDSTTNSTGASTPPATPKGKRKLNIQRTQKWHDHFKTRPADNSDRVRPTLPQRPSHGRSSDFDLKWAKTLRMHMRYPRKLDEASRLVAHNKLQTLWNIDEPDLRDRDASKHAHRVVQLAFIPGSDEKNYCRAAVSVAATNERALCSCTRWNLYTWITSWVDDHLRVQRNFQ
jgi:hypothetical protein